MENTNNNRSIFGSSLVKSIITAVLMLGMLIPMALVEELVRERKGRQQEVIKEVSGKWADEQTVAGPFLIIPFETTHVEDKKEITTTSEMVVLPAHLDIAGRVYPQIRKRSIYKVALFEAGLSLTGDFDLSAVKPAANQTILWNQARFCLGVSDTRGIAAEKPGTWNGSPLHFEAGLPANKLAQQGMSAVTDLSGLASQQSLKFQVPLQLKGSEKFQVLPLGKTTTCQLESAWPSPSFVGRFLPTHRIGKDGFAAKWEVLHFNRSFPQVWMNDTYKADEYAFGLSLLQPTDHYAKTTRSVKYGILIIWLSFGFFFLLEMLLKQSVHPVQYLLVGIALVVFYTLLLSIGEITDFNIAYLIAGTGTLALVTTFSKYLFRSWKYAAIIGGFLGVLYGFVFGLIQLEDTALLAGSIGLFLLVALAMYLSRKIDWYQAVKQPVGQ